MHLAPSVRLAIDIGGTFTDLVLAVPDRWYTTKVLTTPGDPALAVMDGIQTLARQAGVAPADIGLVLHGTTLATNALIERRGARTALITTEGHGDALEIGLENRFDQYDIFMQRPPVLVPRELRFTVPERMSAAGQVLRPLTEAAILHVIDQVIAANVDSVAIGLLHAYINPAHEDRIEAALLKHAGGLAISLSSRVCPEIREYERLSTTCANAYVKPLMAGYLDRLANRLTAVGMTCPLLLMTSGGGLTSLAAAREYPIRLVESGPAGGAMLAVALAKRSGWSDVLAFDMGGTTAKLTLIDEGKPQWSRAFEVARAYRHRKGSGIPVRIPVIDMVEIGAGGGSLAGIDRLQRIHAGPESAGADPGPVAFGRGGTGPTVTDADLVLGKLRPERFAGGTVPLDQAAARLAIQEHVAAPLHVDTLAAAWGICEAVDDDMAAAARSHASETGRALSTRTMLAFGGAAPLHASRLARKLGIRRIVIPRHAGVGSAIGFLLAPVAFEVVRSRHAFVDRLDPQELIAMLDAMRAEARAVIQPLVGNGAVSEYCLAYMRYVGQGFEIPVEVTPQLLAADLTAGLPLAFVTAYRRFYGRNIPGQRMEILSWTLTLSTTAPPLPDLDVPSLTTATPRHGEWFDGQSTGPVSTYEREQLPMLVELPGPALVVEDQTTTVVAADEHFHLDVFGQLIIQTTGAVLT